MEPYLYIINIVFGFAIGLPLIAKYWKSFKEYFEKFANLLNAIESAIEDDIITEEEAREIYKKSKEVKELF